MRPEQLDELLTRATNVIDRVKREHLPGTLVVSSDHRAPVTIAVMVGPANPWGAVVVDPNEPIDVIESRVREKLHSLSLYRARFAKLHPKPLCHCCQTIEDTGIDRGHRTRGGSA